MGFVFTFSSGKTETIQERENIFKEIHNDINIIKDEEKKTFLGSKTWSKNCQELLSFQAKIWQQFLDMPIDMKVLVCSQLVIIKTTSKLALYKRDLTKPKNIPRGRTGKSTTATTFWFYYRSFSLYVHWKHRNL